MDLDNRRKKMTISAFTMVTDGIKYGYPFIENIKSMLPLVDEYIIIDGGSTDGTRKAIESLNESKVKIVNDEDTKWEYNWDFWRIIHNFNRGFQECKGDIVLCLDADYIIHEDSYDGLFQSFKDMINLNKIQSQYCRYNFMLADRFFFKKDRTLAVNMKLCKEKRLNVKWGIDLEHWGWGAEPIIYEKTEHGIIMGKLLSFGGEILKVNTKIFNYGFVFKLGNEITKNQKYRYRIAERNTFIKYDKYKRLPWESTQEEVWQKYVDGCVKTFAITKQYPIKLEEHPKVIQDKIKNLTSEYGGYNLWGNYETASYYK
jgi:glycosyltransferase involved in cell wall biosynthesis